MHGKVYSRLKLGLDLETEGRQVIAVVFRVTFRVAQALRRDQGHINLQSSLQKSSNKNGFVVFDEFGQGWGFAARSAKLCRS